LNRLYKSSSAFCCDYSGKYQNHFDKVLHLRFATKHGARNRGEFGSRVRIKARTMAGMQGILVRVRNCIRVLVALDSISRAFTMAIDNDWLEPVAPKSSVVAVHGKYGPSIQAERLQ
jgi:hypothetical protein